MKSTTTRSVPIVVALGSNLGDRHTNLRRALMALHRCIVVSRLSSVWETEPIDATPGSRKFLNMVVAGATRLPATDLLSVLQGIEESFGRVRRKRNEPRRIDLDLVFYGAHLIRRPNIEVPHPRYHERAFVLAPLAELDLPWVDPRTARSLRSMKGRGQVRRVGSPFRLLGLESA